MGLEPGTTKADVRRCLENWNKGDNGILFLSRAFRLEPGTGWQIDPGILHAPGSLVTYEPQVNSDVFAMVSHHETFGLVYIEALSQGLPVLFTQGQGIDGTFSELVGVAARPSSVAGIRRGLEQIIDN